MPERKWPYRRISDDLRAKIQSGEIADQLPTRGQLAEEYGAAYMTVDKALKILKDEGLIYGIPGMGMFVRE